MSHNNVGVSSVYVSGDGQWKLAGLQYLCTFNELNVAYLKHARIHRYLTSHFKVLFVLLYFTYILDLLSLFLSHSNLENTFVCIIYLLKCQKN